MTATRDGEGPLPTARRGVVESAPLPLWPDRSVIFHVGWTERRRVPTYGGEVDGLAVDLEALAVVVARPGGTRRCPIGDAGHFPPPGAPTDAADTLTESVRRAAAGAVFVVRAPAADRSGPSDTAIEIDVHRATVMLMDNGRDFLAAANAVTAAGLRVVDNVCVGRIVLARDTLWYDELPPHGDGRPPRGGRPARGRRYDL